MFPGALHTLAKLAAIALFFLLWWKLYTLLNGYNSQPARAVYLSPRPVDVFPWLLQTWTAVIYVVVGVGIVFLPFFYHWTWHRLSCVLATYGVASALAFVAYLVWPLTMRRPDYAGPGLGAWLMRNVIALDDPSNCFPSLHVGFAFLAAMFVTGGSQSAWVPFVVWSSALLVTITTITTAQHYLIDVLGGAVLALVAYCVTMPVLMLVAPRV